MRKAQIYRSNIGGRARLVEVVEQAVQFLIDEAKSYARGKIVTANVLRHH